VVRRSKVRIARWKLIVGLLVLIALATTVAWALVEPRTVTVVEDEFSSPDLPEAFDGTRVVYMSDIHAGPFTSPTRASSLLGRVQSLKPDVILLGGDNVGGRVDAGAWFYPIAASRLSAPLGVYEVIGNHDVAEAPSKAIAGMRTAGIQLLNNTSLRLTRGGKTIVLAGIDDESRSPDLAAAASGIREDEFAILLSHGPDPLVQALPGLTKTFDLALVGHTHGGQVTAFGVWAPFVNSAYGNQYRTGWHKIAETPLLVSNGIGMVDLPLRLGAPPQIHLITLRRGEATR
jgi:uncharacterized protein